MRRLFEGGAYLNIVPDKFTFFFIFIQRYTFYRLVFLWTDKVIVNLELREKFTITRAKISVVRISGVRHLLTLLSQMRRLIQGGAYSSKYGILIHHNNVTNKKEVKQDLSTRFFRLWL